MLGSDRWTWGLIRSLVITDPLIILATILMGSLNLVVSFFETDGRRQVAIARAWSRMLIRIAGVKLTVEGLEKLDPGQSYIFAPNHVSYMDTPVVLGHIPANFRFMAKEELFRIPFLGYHLTRAGHIPVPRSDPRGAIRGMNEAAKYIRERNISILVFPEAGRSLTGLKEFKEGAAYIAIKAGVPVVPVGLLGTGIVLPMHSLNIRPGKVIMRIGDPIPTEGWDVKRRAEFTQLLRDRIGNLIGTTDRMPTV